MPETVGVTQSSVSSQASGLSITPSSSKEPTDNWDLQGVREPLDNWDLQGGVKTKVVPATRALTPLEKYQAQFNVDAEFNRIATSCGNDDLGMGQERCMNYMIGLYRGGNPLSSDALKVQTYVNSQSSAPQPSTGNDADCAAKYPNEGDYERYLQCVTQGQSQTPSATDSAYVNPYDNPSDPNDFYAFMDSCDKAWGPGTAGANKCKEPILREMDTTGLTQFPAPVVESSRSAPTEDIARFNSAQPCARRAGNGDCLDEPTGGLQCYSWIASWLPACENYKAASTFVADEKGGTRTTYTSRPYQPESAQGQVTDGYGNVIPNVVTIAQEDTGPAQATGWLKDTQDFFANLFGGSEEMNPVEQKRQEVFGSPSSFVKTSLQGYESQDESWGVNPRFPDGGRILPEDEGGPATYGEDNEWSIWNPSSWPIFQGTEASIKPTRQFSMAVPFSDMLFNQSLAASAFGAFLVSPKK